MKRKHKWLSSRGSVTLAVLLMLSALFTWREWLVVLQVSGALEQIGSARWFAALLLCTQLPWQAATWFLQSAWLWMMLYLLALRLRLPRRSGDEVAGYSKPLLGIVLISITPTVLKLVVMVVGAINQLVAIGGLSLYPSRWVTGPLMRILWELSRYLTVAIYVLGVPVIAVMVARG
jgi:hypothetical protein